MMCNTNELIFIKEAFQKAGVSVNGDFAMGMLVRKPDQMGCCPGSEIRDDLSGWYLYSFDEHCSGTAQGPFSKEALIYAIALKTGLSRQMEAYRFSDADRDIYIHSVIHF